MKVLIIADPLAALKVATDTGLALARESLRRGFETFWTTPASVVASHSSSGQPTPQISAEAQQLGAEAQPVNTDLLNLSNCDIILIRKDPPFDDAYVSLCWLLSTIEQQVVISNRPSLLIQYHEKWIPALAIRDGVISAEEWIPQHVFFDQAAFSRWLTAIEAEVPDARWIVKPWRGYGGGGVLRAERTRDLAATMQESGLLPGEGAVVQRYRERVEVTGDRRVFALDGKVPGSFVRRAPVGSFVTNMAQGGSVEFKDIPENELELCKRVAVYLDRVGFDFAGLDIVDSVLNEVNVTAPTGTMALLKETGTDIPFIYFERLLRRVAELHSTKALR